MAKVLVCISNSIYDKGYKIACFYDQFLNALVQNGNDVSVFIPNMFNKSVFFSDNTLQSCVDEDKLRQDITNFSPELVITFNYATYNRLLECVNCPIVIWDADLIPFWNQVELIRQNLDRYTFFCFSEFGRHYIKSQLNVPLKKTYLVENATSLENQKKEKDVNISFIGTYFGTSEIIDNYIKEHSGENLLLSIMDNIKRDPFIKKEALESVLKRKVEIDEVFYASFFSSENRINTLNAINDLGLELYGDDGWLKLTSTLPSLCARYIRKKVYTAQQNQDIYNRSKVCININHSQSVHGMPWRVFDIMATDGCLISSFSSAIKEKLNKYVSIPMFENCYEARELCQKLLKDDIWRKEIVAASNEYVNKHARWSIRFKQMEKILGIDLCNNSDGNLSILEPKRYAIGNWYFGLIRKKKEKEAKKKKNRIVIKIWPNTYLELRREDNE